MKVKELIKILSEYDGDNLVVLAKDKDGNGFNCLQCVEEMGYDQQNKEIWYLTLTPSLLKAGFGSEDVREDATPAVVLWP